MTLYEVTFRKLWAPCLCSGLVRMDDPNVHLGPPVIELIRAQGPFYAARVVQDRVSGPQTLAVVTRVEEAMAHVRHTRTDV